MRIALLRKSSGSGGTFATTVFVGIGWRENDFQSDVSASTLSPRKLCQKRTLQQT